MRTFLILLLSSLLSLTALAQKSNTDKPYVVVNDGFPTDLRYLVIDAARIESVNVLKDSAALRTYGDKGKNGVVLVRTVPNTTLLRLSAVLDKYNITGKDRELRVCINKTLVAAPDLLLVDESLVTGVEITTDRYRTDPEGESGTEKYINIKTIKPAK